MKKAFTILHISIIIAGFTGVFGRLITLNAFYLSLYRLLISGGILLLLQIFASRNSTNKITTKNAIRIGASGILLALHWVFFYGSIKYSNISIGVICFCLTSFFTAIIHPIVNKRRIDWMELLLSSITLLGIALIFNFDQTYRFGIGLGVISSIFISLFSLFNEKQSKKYPIVPLTLYQMLGGACGLLILLPVFYHYNSAVQYIPTSLDIVYLLILSSVCTVGLYMMITTAMKRIPAFTVNLSFNLEPIYSILLAILIFKENKQLTGAFYLGLLFIVASLSLQMYRIVQQDKQWKLQYHSKQ